MKTLPPDTPIEKIPPNETFNWNMEVTLSVEHSKADKCIEFTIDLWNTFLEIDNLHPCDKNEFCHHLHGIQNLLYAHKYKTEVPNNSMLK